MHCAQLQLCNPQLELVFPSRSPNYLHPPAGLLSCPPHRPPLADSWYSLSYLYLSAVGFTATVTVGLVITSLTGNVYV